MRDRTKLMLLAAGAVAGLLLIKKERNRYSFRDKVVVLTGGSRGLGKAMARRLADEGARLALLSRSREKLESVAQELRQRGGRVSIYKCDVTDREMVESVIDQIEKDFSGIDVLINNAGINITGPFEDHSDEDFEKAWQTHLKGPLYLTRAALPAMRRRGGGRILNVSSAGGKIGIPHMSAYSTSKHALVGFSHSIAAELRSSGIRVTVACPGMIRTGAHRKTQFRGRTEEEQRWFTKTGELPLLGASPDAAARVMIEGCRAGRAEVTFPWHWRLAAMGSGVLPGLSVQANAGVDHFLPEPSEQ